jgi:hypothetical protein
MTTAEAVQVGEESNSYYLIFRYFRQKYNIAVPEADRILDELSTLLYGATGEAYLMTDLVQVKARLGTLQDVMIRSFASTPEGERGLQKLLSELSTDDLHRT